MRIYFDNAATTPISDEAFEAMIPYLKTHFGNPSSVYAEGRTARMAVENARRTIARFLNASVGEIFFTSGGTESNNMAIKCAVRDLGVQRIISSSTEHHCVLHTVEHVRDHEGVRVDWVRLTPQGRPDLNHVEELLGDGSGLRTLVTIMHANNETGVMIDLDRLSEMCLAHGALLHSDTVQTVGHFPIDLQKTKVAFLSGGAHKFHGPKGVGFIYINSDNLIRPFIDGGSQERNMRAGTENLSGIVGMASALENSYQRLEEWRAHIEKVRSYLIERLQERVPNVTFNSDLQTDFLYTVLNVSFPPSPKNDMLVEMLDIAGISVSGGSACSSGSEKGSHVMQAIGHDPSRKAVRFSFSHLNTLEEVDRLIAFLEKW
jgi:cysteine desulfurase